MDSQKNSISIPAAIIAAGIIVAGAVFLSRGAPVTESVRNTEPGIANTVSELYNVPAVTSADHILGNPNALIKLVEYSDLECPACKVFHPSVKQVIDQYGKNGQVAWIYRHFPLVQLHPKAQREAEAAECAAELGGNTKFWAFIDRLFEITPANDRLDPAELPKIAAYIGLDEKLFTACLESGKYKKAVEDSINAALELGANGTPSTYLVLSKPLSASAIRTIEQRTSYMADSYNRPLVKVGSDGKTVMIGAAFQYAEMKTIIDAVLVSLN